MSSRDLDVYFELDARVGLLGGTDVERRKAANRRRGRAALAACGFSAADPFDAVAFLATWNALRAEVTI